MKKQFDDSYVKIYLEVLEMIASEPPSDKILNFSIVEKIRAYLANAEPKNCLSVWNFYKQMLDLVIHESLGDSFMVRLLDLEAVYSAPTGAYAQEAGNMNEAP